MILERLYLENYKQFREPLELAPPEGAIGVVGTNGSGKTTIFEAILWAFFGPSAGGDRFKNELIPWSGGSTKDRTLVQITLDKDGRAYTVERTLRSGKGTARVLADSGEEVVSGPKEVAGWVQGHLLGMDRAAFESTFFARQKELEFFSGVTGVDRQREVAKLLGINRVESARDLLNEDRKEARSRAQTLEARLDAESYKRLEEERESTRSEKERIEGDLKRAEQVFEERKAELEAASKEKARLDGAYQRHNLLSSGLQEARAERQRSADRRSALRDRLREIENDEKEVERLRPRLERLPELADRVRKLDEVRRKVERRETAQGEMARARSQAADAVYRASRLLESLDGPDEEPLPGWSDLLALEDEAEQMRRAGAVLESAPDALREAEENRRDLEKLRDRHAELRELAGKVREQETAVERGYGKLAEVDEELQNITGGEDLDSLRERLRGEREGLEREMASLRGAAQSDEQRTKDLEKARRAVEHTGSEGECPTCHRGFEDEEEHLEVVKTLQEEIEGFRRRAAKSVSKAEDFEREAEEITGRLQNVEQRSKEAAKLQEERLKVSSRLESLEEDLRRESERLEGLRGSLPDSPPSEEEMQTAADRVERLRRIRDAEPRLASLNETWEEAGSTAKGLEEELAELADVSYDAGEHDRLAEERSELEGLRGSARTRQERISRRPEVERQLSQTAEEEQTASERAGKLEAELTELGFDEAVYRVAAERLGKAEERREEARERRDGLSGEQTRLENRLESVSENIRRYEEDRKQADEQANLASRMDRMNALFKEFYRELGGRARPALQTEAGEMVRTLTDGRYESVEFDENYAVRLFDGLSDAYGIERFSGGEADIVSLCARVALSRMISARGSEALGFIVLDEVFGALDAGRRSNVLLALDRLKRVFGQIFVISHVGEVQESALLDELWMVEEYEEGKSTVRRVRQSAEEPAELAGRPRP